MAGNSSTAVSVRHPPGRANILPEEAIAVAGRPVTLVCQAEPQGYPQPTYRYSMLYITVQYISSKPAVQYPSRTITGQYTSIKVHQEDRELSV